VYAGAPAATGAPPKPIYGFAGSSDMNFADLLHFDGALSDENPHFLRIWEGAHTWPEAAEFERACKWMWMTQTKDSLRADRHIQSLLAEAQSKKEVRLRNQLLKEARFFAHALKRNNPAEPILIKMDSDPKWIQKQESLRAELQRELKLKEYYGTAFFQQDLDWWMSEIHDLQHHRKSLPGPMQDRLLGYFSLASYSLSHRALKKNDLEFTRKILGIYQASDPKNPEQAYLRAVFLASRQDSAASLNAIKDAFKLGFLDAARAESQAEFQLLKTSEDYLVLLEKMKSKAFTK
jgi:hypothetical protein